MTHDVALPALAAFMARQLIRPDLLDKWPRSGLFMAAQRCAGQSAFLIHDPIPASGSEGRWPSTPIARTIAVPIRRF